MTLRVHLLPETVISRYSNTYAKKSKCLGVRELPLGRLKMVISTYSNILLSVSMMNMTNCRVSSAAKRPLGLFEVLARNRQSAVELSRRTSRAREKPPRMCTIPPRQRLSITIWLAIRRRNIIRRLGIIDEEFRTARASEKKEKPVYRNTRSRETNT